MDKAPGGGVQKAGGEPGDSSNLEAREFKTDTGFSASEVQSGGFLK